MYVCMYVYMFVSVIGFVVFWVMVFNSLSFVDNQHIIYSYTYETHTLVHSLVHSYPSMRAYTDSQVQHQSYSLALASLLHGQVTAYQWSS